MLSEKYRPTSLSQIKYQDTNIIQKWAETWNSRSSIKAAFLYGPPGTGKTSVAKALANDLNAEYLEINASEIRKPEELQHLLEQTSRNTLTPIIILIDEVDSLSTKAHHTIEEIIRKSKHPIIITANDEYEVRKHTTFYKKECLVVKFNKIKDYPLQCAVEIIAEKEGFVIPDIQALVQASQGDLRYAINNLNNPPTSKYVPQDIFHIVHAIFSGSWDGDFGDNDLNFIWYVVRANIYVFYDTIHEKSVPEFIDTIDRLFSHIYSRGSPDFRYWRYIISLLKSMPPHQKSARIEIPRQEIPEIRNGFYKTRDPETVNLSRYLHVSYRKAKGIEFQMMLPAFRYTKDWQSSARPIIQSNEKGAYAHH